jgi:hypothetical protein
VYPIRRNRERAKHAINVFYVVIGYSVLDLALATWQYFLYSDCKSNLANIDYGLLASSFVLDRLSIFIGLIISIITIVFFILWFRRAYFNLHVIHSSEVSHAEGLAAAAWFIPFSNVILPYRIMREIWNGTQRALPHKYANVEPAVLLGIWWALYIVMGIAVTMSIRLGLYIQTFDDLLPMAIASIAAEVITIPAAFITIHVIKKVSSFEDELWEEALNPSDSVFSVIPAIGSPPNVPPAAPAS